MIYTDINLGNENMPKSSSQQMKLDEQKVIEELQKNAKESIDNIAKKCKFSRQKVWRIIKNLEKSKKIWGYNTVVDDEKMGLKQYLILLKKENIPVSKEQLDLITTRELKSKTSKLGVNIECSYYLHGSFDWFFSITANNISHVKKFVDGLNLLFSGSISEIQIQEVIFPVEKNNVINPNLDQIREFFS